jgi:hypothetical protein
MLYLKSKEREDIKMATITFMDFANSTCSGRGYVRHYHDALKILDYLTEHKGEQFSPKELAEVLNDNYQYVTSLLKVLQRTKCVGSQAYTKTIRIDPWPCYEVITKALNGSNFTVKVLKNTEPYEKKVTAYKWFAL